MKKRITVDAYQNIDPIILLTSWLCIWEDVLTNSPRLTKSLKDHAAMFIEPSSKFMELKQMVERARFDRHDPIEDRIERIKKRILKQSRSAA